MKKAELGMKSVLEGKEKAESELEQQNAKVDQLKSQNGGAAPQVDAESSSADPEGLREHRAAQRKSWRDVARAKTLLAP